MFSCSVLVFSSSLDSWFRFASDTSYSRDASIAFIFSASPLYSSITASIFAASADLRTTTGANFLGLAAPAAPDAEESFAVAALPWLLFFHYFVRHDWREAPAGLAVMGNECLYGPFGN